MEQRIIKFRIWKPEHKRMDSVRLERHFGGRGLYDQNTGCDTGIWRQYTELEDNNGVEIYDGDIVKHIIESEFLEKEDWSIVIGEVKKIDGCWCVDQSRYPLFSFENEVIGNIYESPELLNQRRIT